MPQAIEAAEKRPGPDLIVIAPGVAASNESGSGSTEVPVAAKRIPGDANGDGNVNFIDLLRLSGSFGRVDAVWADGDFNEDGRVNFNDVLILSQYFGTQRDP